MAREHLSNDFVVISLDSRQEFLKFLLLMCLVLVLSVVAASTLFPNLMLINQQAPGFVAYITS